MSDAGKKMSWRLTWDLLTDKEVANANKEGFVEDPSDVCL